MNSRLTSSHSPYLPLDLSIGLNARTSIDFKGEALFDTGFSSDICVPADVVGNGQAPKPEGRLRITLANGESVLAGTYPGNVSFHELADDVKMPINVTVIVLGDEVLVGRGLMDHFRVTLDHGRQLTVEP